MTSIRPTQNDLDDAFEALSNTHVDLLSEVFSGEIDGLRAEVLKLITEKGEIIRQAAQDHEIANICRERLGPAGYKLLEELQDLRIKYKKLKEAASKADCSCIVHVHGNCMNNALDEALAADSTVVMAEVDNSERPNDG